MKFPVANERISHKPWDEYVTQNQKLLTKAERGRSRKYRQATTRQNAPKADLFHDPKDHDFDPRNQRSLRIAIASTPLGPTVQDSLNATPECLLCLQEGIHIYATWEHTLYQCQHIYRFYKQLHEHIIQLLNTHNRNSMLPYIANYAHWIPRPSSSAEGQPQRGVKNQKYQHKISIPTRCIGKPCINGHMPHKDTKTP